MLDPFNVISTNIVSVGITAATALVQYYKAAKHREEEVLRVTKKLSSLLELLQAANKQLQDRPPNIQESNLVNTILTFDQDCEELVKRLQGEFKNFNHSITRDRPASTFERLRLAKLKIEYPLRTSTLQKLEQAIDGLVDCLTLGLQLAQQSDIQKIQTVVESSADLLAQVRASQVSGQVRKWLKAPDVALTFSQTLAKKHPGTGQWFVSGPIFSTWLEKDNSFIWISGFSGCGKSVLSSTIIQHTLSYSRQHPDIGVTFFYFTFRDEKKQDANSLLRSLLLQLSGQNEAASNIIDDFRRSHEHSPPTEEDLILCLYSIIQEFDHVYIVLDALDESPIDTHRSSVLEAITSIREWYLPNLHLIVTSRDLPDIRTSLHPQADENVPMKSSDIDADIASYVIHQLHSTNKYSYWEEEFDQIAQALTTGARGVLVIYFLTTLSFLASY